MYPESMDRVLPLRITNPEQIRTPYSDISYVYFINPFSMHVHPLRSGLAQPTSKKIYYNHDYSIGRIQVMQELIQKFAICNIDQNSAPMCLTT